MLASMVMTLIGEKYKSEISLHGVASLMTYIQNCSQIEHKTPK